MRLPLTLLTLLLATPALASPVVYTNETAFLEAAGELESFTAPSVPCVYESIICRYDLGPFTLRVDSFYLAGFTATGFLAVSSGAYVQATTPLRAIGFDVTADTNQPFSIRFDTLSVPLSGNSFLGVVDEAGISTMALSPGLPSQENGFTWGGVRVDNVQFASLTPAQSLAPAPIPTPEPGTLALFAFGCATVCLRRRR